MKNLTRYSRLVLAVCLCSVVTFANIYWIQPLLPLIQESFHLNSLDTNLAMSLPLLGIGVGLILFASWSDAAGRSKILLAGTGLGIGVSILLPFAENYSIFLILRFFQGVFLAVCPAVAVPLLREELRKSWLASAVGLYISANTLGGLCSRILGGAGATYFGNWNAAGYILGGISLLFFVVIYMLLPEQHHFRREKFCLRSCVHGYMSHMKRPQLLLIYLLIGLAFGTYVNQFNYLMLTLSKAPYYIPSDLRSLLFLTLLGGTASASLAGRFSKKHRLISGVITGLFMMLLANICLSFSQMPMIITGLILTSVGFFFCHAQASTLVGRSVNAAKGSAMALYSLFYYAGASLGVFALEPFYQVWGWQGIIGCTRIALVLCMLWVILYQMVDREKADPVKTV
ncbi:Inner membrane transport protein YnfM [Vibrio aerogenes CECT 7868]|uniref:Inner membrane transport protein YnfM n=1 Tax=Vibrio aerogenes CECT 7868 TaxID=1216006 RepID=A0A1M6CFH4_9VIBR|nr:MFS transporter [Vibrio aerogenes]SHI59752.1 Inner membrane transport protein YnfM [Vibrio aerogenes CECT 7868]